MLYDHKATLVGLIEGIASRLNLTDQIPENCTLNYALGISNQANNNPRTAYAYMFGNNGSLARSNNQPNLKSPIPLIHRPLSNPLTAVERANYRLRKEITVGNTSYEFF